ncbi:DUF1572 family protein [candidate division KSB1 bacterium]|nr:DUF1572 family protein [candidate division KSB1 bacterium]
MIIESIKAEFLKYKRIGEGAIRQAPDNGFNKPLGEGNNSITVIVRHISGNLKSRFTDFLTSDGEKPWRNRGGEFESVELDPEGLIKVWDEGWKVLSDTLDTLTDDDMEKTVTLYGKELSVIAAILQALTHVSYHVGQIVTIARSLTGDDWQTLSIAKGKPSDHNKNQAKN